MNLTAANTLANTGHPTRPAHAPHIPLGAGAHGQVGLGAHEEQAGLGGSGSHGGHGGQGRKKPSAIVTGESDSDSDSEEELGASSSSARSSDPASGVSS